MSITCTPVPERFLPTSIPADDLMTPALSIDMVAVRHNIERVLDAIGDPSCWRPHLKTTKLPAIWSLLLEAGIERFKCATTLEMQTLLQIAPESDILFAHHPSPAALRRISDLADAHPLARLSVLVETCEAVAALPDGVDGFLDLNSGMNRTGIPMTDGNRIDMVACACGDRWRGLHFYEGHLKGGEEASRRNRAHAAFDLLLDVDRGLGGAAEIITSGTPTFLHALSHAALVGTMRHAVSPGTVVLHDGISSRLPEIERLGLTPAAVVLAHVVSQPCDHVVTVNAGHKSVSVDAGAPCCTVLEYDNLVPLHPSEEHMPIQVLHGVAPERGTLLALQPEHVCPTVNLAHQVLLCDENGATVVNVAAAGHDAPVASQTV